MTEPRDDEMLGERDFAIGELVDALGGMIAFSRVGTFDEVEGERDAYERAIRVAQRYNPAS